MADNDIRIVVDAENRTATAFGAAAKGAKTVGDVAERAGKQVEQMGARSEAAAVKARRLAEAEEAQAAKTRALVAQTAALRKRIEETGDASGKLTARLERLQIATRASAERTDDYRRAANRAATAARDQAAGYDRVAANAREAARAVALLGAAATLSGMGGAAAGKGGGRGWFDRLAGGVEEGLVKPFSATGGLLSGVVSNPYGLALGITGATVAAPAIGAVAGGTIGLGAAGAVAGGGLAAAWMGNPEEFEGRWRFAIDAVKERWLASGKEFEEPLRDALREVDRLFRDLPVERLAEAGKSFVGPLVQGAGGGLTQAADGFADLVAQAQPFVDQVAPELVELGHGIGDALRAIAVQADGGGEAVGDLVGALGWLARATGVMILGFERAYEVEKRWVEAALELNSSIPGTGEVFDYLATKLFKIEETGMSAGKALGEVSDEAAAAAQGVAELSYALDAVQERLFANKNAELALAQGWIDLDKELKNGKKTLSLATEEGIKNQEALLQQAELAKRAADSYAEMTGDVDGANAVYAIWIEKLKLAAYAAGFNKQEVDALIESISAIPPTATTQIKTPGMAEALSNGISLGNALNNINGQTYTANVVVHYRQQGQSLNAPLAAGGPSSASGNVVNDWSRSGAGRAGSQMFGGDMAGLGEVIKQPTGSMVIPAGSARALMRDIATGGAGGGFGGTLDVQFSIARGRGAGDALLDLLVPAINARGGDSTVLTGPGGRRRR